jgi:AraC-like DNA-binding protein
MSFAEYFKDYQVTKHILGALFIILLWIYSIYSICLISKYKKQICSLYSFNSYKNNLNWLLVVVISFLTTYNSIVVSSFFNTLKTTTVNIELYRSGVILFLIYIVNIGGLKQQKLITIDEQEKKTSELDKDTIFMGTDSEKYTRSSLKLSQAEGYVKCLVDYMNNSKAWKDQELSIAKLSSETGIPKHHITQILNENLQKNFYTFVNEYRTEQAKLLIASPKYENWSFVAIAYECGFNSKTAFNTFFKKYTNMTPTEYKRMIFEKTA